MSDANMGPSEPIVSHHFKDREQQTEASHIGMWLFLAQESCSSADCSQRISTIVRFTLQFSLRVARN